ncbi:hypothetical protein PR202_ga23493 [Eleusine coracana subsp. coracana]|uniref:Uncharacterized protein n=1 Tax=Eleusine coracana subsp. coracana TaxID=191504 RepID=A0AAV5D5Z4_ELECO|nr:hypothetical protein PR202_ga23493 [Eleusine coracana subsp. coracana]
MSLGGIRRGEKKDDGAAASKLRQNGLIGLAAASLAITLLVCKPPPGLSKNVYFLTISVAFFAGVTEVFAAVWAMNDGRRSQAAGRKLVYCASLVSLVAAIGVSLAYVFPIMEG